MKQTTKTVTASEVLNPLFEELRAAIVATERTWSNRGQTRLGRGNRASRAGSAAIGASR